MTAKRILPIEWLRRVCLVAERTCAIALRQRVLHLFAVLLTGLLVSAHWLAGVDFGGDPFVFVYEFGISVIFLVGTLIALILPAQFWLGETVAGACIPLLAGRRQRLDVFFGIFFGSVMGISAFMVPAFLLLILLLLYWFPQHLDHAFWILLPAACLLEWCRLGIIAAFGALIGSCSRSMFFSLMVGAAFVLSGELYGVLWSLFEDTPQDAAIVPVLMGFVPNLGLFSVSRTIFQTSEDMGVSVPVLLTYAAAYGCFYLSIGGWLFRRRSW